MDRRILKTKDAIKSTYKKLLLENKNSKITITKLAQHANIDRKTFYLHYTSIDDIMQEIVDENLSELELILKEYGIFQKDFSAKTLINAMNSCLIKDIDFYKTLMLRNDFQFLINEIKEILTTITIRDFNKNTNLSQKELYIYCKFMVSGIADVYFDWLLNQDTMSIDELSDIITHIINSGIQVFSYKESTV